VQIPLQGGEFLRADLATDKGKVVVFSVLHNNAVEPSIISPKNTYSKISKKQVIQAGVIVQK